MKKLLLSMTAILSLGMAVVSCSKTDLYEEGAAEKAQQAETVAKYKEAFVKHFGEIAPNQSWDFTQSFGQGARTRGANDPTWTQLDNGHQKNYPHIKDDYQQAIELAASNDVPVVEWPYEYAEIKLYPFYGHGDGKYAFFFLGLDTNKKYLSVNLKDNKYYSLWTKALGTENLNFNSHRHINTYGKSGFQWWIGCAEPNYKNDMSKVTKYNLVNCKCFIVNGHTYVAFDCNNNNDYTDLICWVEDITPSKRYMVEDLGGDSDFDFNDIVFDVRPKAATVAPAGPGPRGPQAPQPAGKKYECLVRAMGGTLDFTIKVGGHKEARSGEWKDYTTWSKGKDFTVTKMYNTEDPDYADVVASFEITEWDVNQNLVEVTVEGKTGQFILPFPEDGTVPFMMAVSVAKNWSKEFVSVRDLGWFITPDEVEE